MPLVGVFRALECQVLPRQSVHGVQALNHGLHSSRRTAMRQLLHRALALALASAASLVLLSSVASLAASDRAALAQARQAQAVLLAARADAVRR